VLRVHQTVRTFSTA